MKTEPYAIFRVRLMDSIIEDMVFCHGKTYHHKVNNGDLEIYNDDKVVAIFKAKVWKKVEVDYKIMDYPETIEEKIQDHINFCRRMGGESSVKEIEEWTEKLNQRLSKLPTS